MTVTMINRFVGIRRYTIGVTKLDFKKLEHHRSAFTISEEWLVQAELTPEELKYICHRPATSKKAKPKQHAKFLSATKSKQIEKYSVKQW